MNQMGCPILGDVKYADESIVRQYFGDWHSKNSIALAATAISFKLAAEDKSLNLEIPLPAEWDKYI
jgi:23S rRNA-/tRNA-specific pseudouridylate synthase